MTADRTRRQAERDARDLLRARAHSLAEPAPVSLRQRCVPAAPETRLRARGASVALLVAIVLVGGAAIGSAIAPGAVLAAELAIDHVTCARLAPATPDRTPAACARAWRANHGWDLVVPGGTACGLELIGSAPCATAPEDTAHLVYRATDGSTVSLFVLPDGRSLSAAFGALGQHAVCWSSGGRAYAIVMAGGAGRAQQVAAGLRAEIDGRPEMR